MKTQIDAIAVRRGTNWSVKFMLEGRELETQVHRLNQAEAAVKDAAAEAAGCEQSAFNVSVRVRTAAADQQIEH